MLLFVVYLCAYLISRLLQYVAVHLNQITIIHAYYRCELIPQTRRHLSFWRTSFGHSVVARLEVFTGVCRAAPVSGVFHRPPTQALIHFSSPRFAQRASGKVQGFAFIERRTNYTLIRRKDTYNLPRPGCRCGGLFTNYRQRRAGSLRCDRAHIVRLRK